MATIFSHAIPLIADLILDAETAFSIKKALEANNSGQFTQALPVTDYIMRLFITGQQGWIKLPDDSFRGKIRG